MANWKDDLGRYSNYPWLVGGNLNENFLQPRKERWPPQVIIGAR